MYAIYHNEAPYGKVMADSKKKFEDARKKTGVDGLSEKVRNEMGAETRISWEAANRRVR